MARNNAWSNRRLHAACALLDESAFAAPRAGFFPSLSRTLNHVLAVDRAYLADLEGGGRGAVPAETSLPAGVLAVEQARTDAALVAFCDGLDGDGLERIVVVRRADGAVWRETVCAILSHLFVHQIHHRGQAHAMLSATSVRPPQLDEFFLAADAPLRGMEMRRLGFGD